MAAPHNPLEGAPADLTLNLHDGSDEQVSIIVVHRDRPEFLNICLQSIAVTSINNNYEIIVVDNGSVNQDAIDYLEDLKNEHDIKVIRNDENRWWAAAANQGAKAASKNSRYMIFMHPDVVIINPAWMDLLINVSEANQSGVVGIESGSYLFQTQKIDFVQEWMMLVSKECWQDCGPFSEELPQVGAPFIFTLSAQRRGYRPQIIGKTPIAHHYRVFGLDVNDYEKFTEQAMVVIPRLVNELQRPQSIRT